ncbi:MAG: hypothetical protein ACI3ZY_04625, partial [Parabacteroides sp.]
MKKQILAFVSHTEIHFSKTLSIYLRGIEISVNNACIEQNRTSRWGGCVVIGSASFFIKHVVR